MGGWARFQRIRIEIDITKPLKRAVMLGGLDDKGERWGRLGYERMPYFYYECQMVGYGEVDCEKKEFSNGNVTDSKYGN